MKKHRKLSNVFARNCFSFILLCITLNAFPKTAQSAIRRSQTLIAALVFFAIGIVLFYSSVLAATTMLVEDFSYTPGTALTANGWTAHSAAGTNPITVVSPGLTYAGYPSSGVGNTVALTTTGEDDSKTFTSQTSGSVYAAAMVNITSTQTTGDYFFHMGPSPIGTSFFARVFVKKDPSSTNFAFGIQKGSTANAAYTPFSYVPGTTYLIVVKYNFVAGATNDTANLFVNPTLGGVEPSPTVTATVDTSADATNIGSVALRQGSSTSASILRIDGIRVGDTWDNATGDFAPSVSSTVPLNAATGVPVNQSLSITFSEAVTVTGNWFQIVCPSSGTRNVADTAVTGGPTTFTIDPTADFANGETCSVTVFAAQVTDQDALDPPDNMAANSVFNFTTVSPLPNLSINDVTLNEGNSGTTVFTFTVSLSTPAPTGGVTFDVTTLNNTAVSPGDYTTKTLTSQTIPASSSTYPFTVTVIGDTTAELDEIFNVSVTNVSNALVLDGQGLGTIVNDDIYKIHEVQGSGAASPLAGQTVIVEGVVVANFQGTNKLQGFFLEEEDADWDADPNTSEGIFVYCNTCPIAVAEGHRVQLTGVVSEFNGMTEITASTVGSVVIVSTGNPLPTPASIDLPIVGDVNAFYEAREGMKVTFVDTLSVSEYFELGRYGQIVLYEGGRPRQFTEANAPSVAGNAAYADTLSRRKVILDDDNNAQEWYLTSSSPPGPADGLQYVYYPRANGGFSVGTQGTDFFRGGDLVNGLTGVLHWSFPGFGAESWRIRPTAANVISFTVANPRPATPPAVSGAIKAAGMNLLNYFTTIDTTSSNDTGPCSPSGNLDCRGADSVAELNRQRERASIVVCTVNADVYGFAELENTTAHDSIVDLLGAINTRCGGTHPYTYADTGGTLGTDAIRVQQIYRTGVLTPTIAPLVDLNPIHSRPPTAQTYDVVDATNPAFGQRFTVIINHFKSKGSSAGLPGDNDAGDGAGFSNATRTAQATRLLTWITSTVVPAAGDPDVLLLGDFNAYANEDPIATLQAGGFNDLETTFHGANAYSYLFDGQLGHLDYGFANTTLFPQITGADAWHINADESDMFDYNDEVRDSPGEATFEEKPDGSALVPPRVVFAPGTPYRASDHDPVLVGIFATANLSVTKSVTPGTVFAGDNLTYSIAVSNTGPTAALSASLTDTLPVSTTFVSLGSPGGWSCSTPSIGATGTISCTIPSMAVGSANFTLVVALNGAGTITNTANVSSATMDPNPGNESSNVSKAVGKLDTATTLTSSPNPSTVGQSVTFTATVSIAPSGNRPRILSLRNVCGTTGNVDFKEGSTILGTGTLNGACVATFTTSSLSVGTHIITAVYNGDASHNGSASAPYSQVVSNVRILLPLVLKNAVAAPDLIIQSISAVTNSIQVTIKNNGTTPVVDEFWVDVYINPNPSPTHVNQTWQMLGSRGMVWGVTASALPLNPGQSLTLQINDAYYWASLSNVTFPLALGTPVYAQVDSANANVSYGAVLENHEIANTPYNNISSTTVVAGGAPVQLAPATLKQYPNDRGRLPVR